MTPLAAAGHHAPLTPGTIGVLGVVALVIWLFLSLRSGK